ncbi:related to sucrose transporter SUT1D [Rhynchosporium agropyri]|uniref:Related to sucrose transporter SUT1D n=2 Tax=Rhynchosporium TaxID=38037 RepID=A0A1E1KCU5_9HELO|nr:related to sucrose transporter SUT1D [Rhynchosporium agropyri]CZT03496.1 related to sucrose transporter SUT1D [Rhynchosporium commune]
MSTWQGKASVKGSSERMRMALLTFSLVGLQFTWGIEMTYCTPYLLSLGLTKSRTSLVWIAGPISGLIMQPIVGVIADQSTSKYGRRRPFMVVGSFLVAASLMVLGWTKEIVAYFVEEGDFRKECTVTLAVLSIYAIDFAINAVQGSCRSLITDTLPAPKQQAGSAWASRMVAIGHLVGYVIGTVDLIGIFGRSYGDTQFKKLILLAAFALVSTVAVTSWAVTERVLVSSKDDNVPSKGLTHIVSKVYRAASTLPPRMQAICNIQLWMGVGWFPFMFYSTTFVGEIYFRYDAPQNLKHSSDSLGEIGRIGSFSLVIFSFVTFVGALVIPLFVKSPDDESFTARPPAAIANVVTKVNEYKPDLLTGWIYGHLLFSSAMILAPLAHSFRFATFLVALCGIPWVFASWAPSTFMGIEVTRMSNSNSRRGSKSSPIELNSLEKGSPSADAASSGELSGLYFGILNIYAVIPQFISTFISMIVFNILEPGKSPELAHDADPSEHHSTDGPNAIAVCLFIGAISTLGAAFATKKLRKLHREGYDRL